MRILMEGDPFLRHRSIEVDNFDQSLVDLIVTMFTTITEQRPAARGLAAIQIGMPVRVIVARDGAKCRYMVNPVITRTLNRSTVENEGCLSVPPKNWRPVSRPAKCEIDWQDHQGVKYSEGFSGDWARVLQHEIDHLDGVLIVDKDPI